jgi:hypothetical protein
VETLTLATPEVIPQITTTDYRLIVLGLYLDEARIEIRLRGTNGERRDIRIEGAEATTLMLALNTANLSIKSLQRRVLEYLASSGRLLGTVTGTVE